MWTQAHVSLWRITWSSLLGRLSLRADTRIMTDLHPVLKDVLPPAIDLPADTCASLPDQCATLALSSFHGQSR